MHSCAFDDECNTTVEFSNVFGLRLHADRGLRPVLFSARHLGFSQARLSTERVDRDASDAEVSSLLLGGGCGGRGRDDFLLSKLVAMMIRSV